MCPASPLLHELFHDDNHGQVMRVRSVTEVFEQHMQECDQASRQADEICRVIDFHFRLCQFKQFDAKRFSWRGDALQSPTCSRQIK